MSTAVLVAPKTASIEIDQNEKTIVSNCKSHHQLYDLLKAEPLSGVHKVTHAGVSFEIELSNLNIEAFQKAYVEASFGKNYLRPEAHSDTADTNTVRVFDLKELQVDGNPIGQKIVLNGYPIVISDYTVIKADSGATEIDRPKLIRQLKSDFKVRATKQGYDHDILVDDALAIEFKDSLKLIDVVANTFVVAAESAESLNYAEVRTIFNGIVVGLTYLTRPEAVLANIQDQASSRGLKVSLTDTLKIEDSNDLSRSSF